MSGAIPNIFLRNLHTTTVKAASKRCPTPPPAIPQPGHEGGYKIYKTLFFILGLPTIIGLSIMNYMRHMNHNAKCHRLPYVEYEFLRIHTKRWPWGGGLRSAFHNPDVNPLPGIGYEDEQGGDEGAK